MVTPAQKPGRSRQDYATPEELVRAIERLIGAEFEVDLAADSSDTICAEYVGPTSDSLTTAWHALAPGKWLWCNPPFADIAPWARKCIEESAKGARIALLVPASVGSNWYRDHIHGKARVLFLNPRLTFVGCSAPYPKDCMIALFDAGQPPGCECWRWKP